MFIFLFWRKKGNLAKLMNWLRYLSNNYCYLIFKALGWCLTTVFVDTRLWKTKHSRKRFQNFRQTYVLSTYRIEIHQSQPASTTTRRSEGHASGCDCWISIRSSITRKTNGNFGKVSADVFCFPKSRINENGGNDHLSGFPISQTDLSKNNSINFGTKISLLAAPRLCVARPSAGKALGKVRPWRIGTRYYPMLTLPGNDLFPRTSQRSLYSVFRILNDVREE